MNRQDALAFLQAHQPLPTDDALAGDPRGQKLLDAFDEARRCFNINPDPAALPLLLGACGDVDGFGVYRLLDDTFLLHHRDIVVPLLIPALKSHQIGVRFRAVELSALFPDNRLIPHLISVYLKYDEEHQFAALLALTRNPSTAAKNALTELRGTSMDDECTELLEQYFSL